MPKYDYDLITIGAGSGGVRASRLAAQSGANVAIVEESRVGGTCVIRGCVPKKLLIYGAHFADDFEDAGGYGWTLAGEPGFDWARLIAAKNREIDRLNGVYIKTLGDNGVKLVQGRAQLADPHTVEVGPQRMTAKHILIATGSSPKLPEIPGIEHVITSNEALDLLEKPKRLAIVGGGYIAVEFAGIFNTLGTQVTEVIRAESLLRGFDDDMRILVGEEMVKRGIDLRTGTVVDKIDKTEGKKNARYTLGLAGGGKIEADLVMYATGRAPNTAGLGLEESGVKLNDKGAVAVDEFSRTNRASVHAVGDVTDRMNLTPVAIAEAAALIQTLFHSEPTAVDYANVPTAVFSQPPIGTVGLTEAAARAKLKKNVDVYTSGFKPMKHTLSGRDEKTFMKMVVNARTGRVLGCHMLGMDAPEIVQGLGIALKCKAKKAHFDATIGIHPTAAEEFVTMREKRGEES